MKQFLQEIMLKNNTWNIRHLVIHPSDPATQQPSDSAYYIEDCRIFGLGLPPFSLFPPALRCFLDFFISSLMLQLENLRTSPAV